MDSSLQFARTATGVVPTRCLSRSAERPRHYTATGVVATGCLSEFAERHGSADDGTTPPRVWCRRAAFPRLRNATVLRTVALHRHGCGADALLLQICGTPRFCGPWHYTATGVVTTTTTATTTMTTTTTTTTTQCGTTSLVVRSMCPRLACVLRQCAKVSTSQSLAYFNMLTYIYSIL